MSMDALLWVATLLFAATMLILAARRPPETGESGGEASSNSGDDPWDSRSAAASGIDLGDGWTLGGDRDRA